MTQEKDIREMTADTIGRDILQALVQEIKLLPDLWVKMPKRKQDDVINRLRARVEYNVRMAVHLIASQNRTTIIGDLEQVTSKDGIKAVFKISANADGRHNLLDQVGKACLIVIANAEEAVAGMDDVQGEPDQRAMDLNTEYTDQDGDGMDDGTDGDNVIDVEVTAIEHQPLQAEFDEAYQQGWDAAAEGKSQDDCPRMAGALCIQWIKGWKAWHAEHGHGDDETDDETDTAAETEGWE